MRKRALPASHGDSLLDRRALFVMYRASGPGRCARGRGGVGVGSRGRGSRNHMDGREIEQFVTSQMGTQN